METFIIAAIIGVIIGIFSGLLGIGGGTLMVPIFRLGFGMSAISSTATSLFTIIPTSLAGLITHVKNKTCIPKVGVLCGLGGACTSPLGVYLASISPSWAIMFAAAAIIGYSSYSMFRKAIRMPKIAPQGESAVTGRKSGASSSSCTSSGSTGGTSCGCTRRGTDRHHQSCSQHNKDCICS